MRKAKGRPKSFDEHEVVMLAMNYFWEHGYDKSSLDDLLKVMQITKGSFYHIFKSKEELFSKTLELYRAKQIEFLEKLKNEVGAKEMVLKLVDMILDELKSTDGPKGCLLVNSGKECYGRYNALSNQIKYEYNAMQEFMTKVIKEAKEKGEITSSLEAKQLNARFMNMLNGLVFSVQAGATEEAVDSIVKQLRDMLK